MRLSDTMRRWVEMLAGLTIWAAHFIGAYVISSVGDVASAADAPEWRAANVVFSAVCGLALIAVLVVTVRRMRREPRDELSGFISGLGAMGAALGLLGVVYQTLPNLIGY